MRWSLRTRSLALPEMLIIGLVLVASGCASNREHRSAGQVVDDVSIQARIKAKMIDDPRVRANDVNVEVSRGVVTLLGWVETNQARKAATEIARSVEGVRQVDNRIRLKLNEKGQPPREG